MQEQSTDTSVFGLDLMHELPAREVEQGERLMSASTHTEANQLETGGENV